jgi:hypothetical protein
MGVVSREGKRSLKEARFHVDNNAVKLPRCIRFENEVEVDSSSQKRARPCHFVKSLEKLSLATVITLPY